MKRKLKINLFEKNGIKVNYDKFTIDVEAVGGKIYSIINGIGLDHDECIIDDFYSTSSPDCLYIFRDGYTVIIKIDRHESGDLYLSVLTENPVIIGVIEDHMDHVVHVLRGYDNLRSISYRVSKLVDLYGWEKK